MVSEAGRPAPPRRDAAATQSAGRSLSMASSRFASCACWRALSRPPPEPAPSPPNLPLTSSPLQAAACGGAVQGSAAHPGGAAPRGASLLGGGALVPGAVWPHGDSRPAFQHLASHPPPPLPPHRGHRPNPPLSSLAQSAGWDGWRLANCAGRSFCFPSCVCAANDPFHLFFSDNSWAHGITCFLQARMHGATAMHAGQGGGGWPPQPPSGPCPSNLFPCLYTYVHSCVFLPTMRAAISFLAWVPACSIPLVLLSARARLHGTAYPSKTVSWSHCPIIAGLPLFDSFSSLRHVRTCALLANDANLDRVLCPAGTLCPLHTGRPGLPSVCAAALLCFN